MARSSRRKEGKSRPRARTAPLSIWPHRNLRIEQLESRCLLSGSQLPNDSDTALLVRFDGNSVGESGEVPIAAVGISYQTGLVGQAAHTASPGYLRYSTSQNINALAGTVEFWIAPDWNGNTGVTHIFFEAGDNFNNGMLLAIDGANNLRFIQWGDDRTTVPVEVAVERGLAVGGSSWKAGEWRHFVATWDGSVGSSALYIDGNLIDQRTDGVRINAFSGSYFSIGAEVDGGNTAQAAFDEFRISTRERSAGEVQASYFAGQGIDALIVPRGIDVDATGRTLVAESGADHIAVFNNAGTRVATYGGRGTGNGQFRNPYGVAVAPNGNIIVADSGNDRVQILSSSGVYISQFGSSGSAASQFHNPQGIAVDPVSGLIYVADTDNHRVQRFLPNGVLDTAFNGTGVLGTTGVVKRDHTGFDRPGAIAINPVNGLIYVADFGNDRLEVFNGSGVYQRTFLAVYRPRDIAFDAAGNLYIAGEDPGDGYTAFDGRLRLLRAGDELISEHYAGGLDDLSRLEGGVAVAADGRVLTTDVQHGRVVQTNSKFVEPITDLRIEAHGNVVTWRWHTAIAGPSTVRFGSASELENVITSPAISTEHEVTASGASLLPDTRLVYSVGFTDPFDNRTRWTPTDAMNTGVLQGQTQFLRLKAVGLIYTDTNPGVGFTAMDAATLADARSRFQTVSDFYWRNSGFKLWLDIQIVEINRDLTAASNSLFGFVQTDLAARGFSGTDDLDAAWATSTMADGNFGGGGTLFGRFVGMSEWVTQSDFVAIHEVNHSIDSIYSQIGLPKYEFNHGLWAVPNGVGRDFAVNGQILRNMLSVNFAATVAPFTKRMSALDTDNDGVPDSSPAGLTHSLSITESTLGTSIVAADTDGDGLNDFNEATALDGNGTNPLNQDTDGDGKVDGTDPNPAYASADYIAKGSPTMDGQITAQEGWTLFTDSWGYSNQTLMPDTNLLQGQTKTYVAWDDDYLYLALKGPASDALVYLDGSADNWYFGPDNYKLDFRNDISSKSVSVNVGVPDVFRQIDDDGQFSEFFDTDPQFIKPYQGQTIYNHSNDGLGFAGRLVTEQNLVYQRGGSGNQLVWEVAIPWSNTTQLRGGVGKTMALSIELSGDRLFETDHAAKFTLVQTVPGDYNQNRTVDAADYVVWRKTAGATGMTPYTGADGSGNGSVGTEDYGAWRAQFGASVPAIGAGSEASVERLDNVVAKSSAQGNDLFRAADFRSRIGESKEPRSDSLEPKVALNVSTIDDALVAWAALRGSARGASSAESDFVLRDTAESDSVPSDALDVAVSELVDASLEF